MWLSSFFVNGGARQSSRSAKSGHARSSLPSGQHVGVGIERDADVGVPEEFLDEFGVLAHLQQYDGAGMPEVVHAHGAGETGAFGYRLE